uniref:Kinesin-like protein n=1 Tax=Alexandrium andersonii TaxID=327968 RepID=A0A7S2BJJ4_9DINO
MVLDCARCGASSFAEAEELLIRGYSGRAAGGTLCNERSSRSHVVLFATCMRGNDAEAPGGQLILVDLAGSENVQRSGADEDSKLLAEAKAINKSLSALADVVEATSKRQQFVPYRNSKLTMLLEDALTSAKVLMMVHVSPLSRDATDSGHSLNFAGRVQAVDFGAQRMRAEQEERLKASMQRLRKEKEAVEAKEAELRKQNALLTEQLHSRPKEPPVDRSAPPAKLEEGNMTPYRRRPLPTEQRAGSGIAGGPTARASPELRHVFGRAPTPEPRTIAARGRQAQSQPGEHEPHARMRQPTPRPSRQTCEALMAQDASSDGEEPTTAVLKQVAHRRAAAPRAEPSEDPPRANAEKADAACEDGKGRVLSDITNLPGAGEKEGKDPALAKGQLSQRAGGSDVICQIPERCFAGLLQQGEEHTAESDTVWIDQELLGAREGEIQAEAGEAAAATAGVLPKPALKKEKTNFALKMKQRRLQMLEDAGMASPSSARRVHFDDEGIDAKSPPKWYLALLEYDRQEARAREEEAGVSPAGRSQRGDRSSRRVRELRVSESQEPSRWR